MSLRIKNDFILKSFIFLPSLLVFFLLMPGCSGSSLSDAVNRQSSFTYELSENGCSTGEKTFSTNDAMCNALKDDALNHYCAQNLRYQKFLSDCPGKTW
jgi:hypothetical protein